MRDLSSILSLFRNEFNIAIKHVHQQHVNCLINAGGFAG